jgi:hypothetical protein
MERPPVLLILSINIVKMAIITERNYQGILHGTRTNVEA